MNNPQSSDDIEAKLQSVEANLRKERDVARRKLQVADEKCRIAQGEVNSVKEQIDTAQTELAKLQDEIPRQEEIDERTHSLEVLSNEVRFQHSELLHKREKVEDMERRLDKETKDRNAMVSRLRRQIHDQRQKAHATTTNHTNTVTATQVPWGDASVFEQDLLVEQHYVQGAGRSDGLRAKWTGLVRSLTRRFQAETQRMERTELARMERIVNGYQQNFPGSFSLTIDENQEASMEITSPRSASKQHSNEYPDLEQGVPGASVTMDENAKERPVIGISNE